MFVIGDLINALAYGVGLAIEIYIWIVILRVIFFWVNADPYNGFVRLVGTLTEPLLAPIRRALPPWRLHGVDLSPMIVIIALYILRAFLVPVLYDLGAHLR